jgi:hypothetical protein
MKDIHQIVEQCIHLPQECNTQEQILLERVYILQGAVIEILNRTDLIGLQFYIEYFSYNHPEKLPDSGEKSIDFNRKLQMVVTIAVDEVLRNHPRVQKWKVIPQEKWIVVCIKE